MTIRYTLGRCSLGRLLLAATDIGVCGISLGDTNTQVEDWLRDKFPNRTLKRDDTSLREWFTLMTAALEAGTPMPSLPIDVHSGTPLFRRVWDELTRIPFGEVRTYAEVASAIGHPKAVRAVARACATNPVSLLVPCHRVVGSDGTLRGYGWGLDRKQKLIDMEQSGV